MQETNELNATDHSPDWVTVSESVDEFIIRIQKVALEAEGIPSILFNQRDSTYNAFGLIYLKVERKHFDVAMKLLHLDHE